MPWTVEEPKWVPEEFPKALNDEDGKPVLWPFGHAKAGHPVVFENADEEAAYGRD